MLSFNKKSGNVDIDYDAVAIPLELFAKTRTQLRALIRKCTLRPILRSGKRSDVEELVLYDARIHLGHNTPVSTTHFVYLALQPTPIHFFK